MIWNNNIFAWKKIPVYRLAFFEGRKYFCLEFVYDCTHNVKLDHGRPEATYQCIRSFFYRFMTSVWQSAYSIQQTGVQYRYQDFSFLTTMIPYNGINVLILVWNRHKAESLIVAFTTCGAQSRASRVVYRITWTELGKVKATLLEIKFRRVRVRILFLKLNLTSP